MRVYLPSAELIKALKTYDPPELLKLDNDQLRPILSTLVPVYLLTDRFLYDTNAEVESVWLKMHEFPEINDLILLYRKVDFDDLDLSLKSADADWIASQIVIPEGQSSVSLLDNGNADSTVFMAIVNGLMKLRNLFDSALCQQSSVPDDGWELLNCSLHWIKIVNLVNIVLLELGDNFDVVDVAESFLCLNTEPACGDYSFGASLAWWLLASNPYELTNFVERIISWKLPQNSNGVASVLQRLSRNRLSFLTTFQNMGFDPIQVTHLSIGSHTIPQIALSLVSRLLSESFASCCFDESSKLEQSLSLASSLLISESVCWSNGKSRPLYNHFQWVAKHESLAQDEFDLLRDIRSTLEKIISQQLESWNSSGGAPNGTLLSNVIKLIAALQLGVGLPKLDDDEVKLLGTLYRLDFPQTTRHIEVVRDIICLGCAIPELLTNEQFVGFLSSWLELWKMGQRAAIDSLNDVGELIIQIGMQCFASATAGSSQISCQSALANILAAQLRLPSLTIASQHLILLRKAIVSSVLPESAMASSVLLISPEATDLVLSNSDEKLRLATNCVSILLKSPNFVKNQSHLELKDWLLTQLKTGVLARDLGFHSLLQNETNGGVAPWNAAANAQFNPLVGIIKAEELKEIVTEALTLLISTENEASATCQINILLGVLVYALTCLDCLTSSCRSGNSNKDLNAAQEMNRMIEIIESIPVKVILFQMEKSISSYANIRPVMTRLLYSYFPHLCLVEDCLNLLLIAREEMSRHINLAKKGKRSRNRTTDEHLREISEEPFVIRCRHAEYLISLLPHIINGTTQHLEDLPCGHHYSTIRVFANSFYQTATGFTTKQICWAALTFVGSTPLTFANTNSSVCLSDSTAAVELFMKEPLTFLYRLSSDVFKQPLLLEVALWLHFRLLAANRQFFTHRIMVQSAANINASTPSLLPPAVLVPLENAESEAAVALDLLQQCESVIYLLEKLASYSGDALSIIPMRSVICAFIHQLFLQNHQLVKLVHFQTYPLAAVSVVVAMIPSIYVCLDFLPELLTTSSPSRQIFSLVLLSHIATLYAVPRAFALAKLAVDVVDTMVTTMNADKRSQFFNTESLVLESLTRLASCFPPLIEDVIQILMRVYGMSQCQRASLMVTASPWPPGVIKDRYQKPRQIQSELKSTLLKLVKNSKSCKIFLV